MIIYYATTDNNTNAIREKKKQRETGKVNTNVLGEWSMTICKFYSLLAIDLFQILCFFLYLRDCINIHINLNRYLKILPRFVFTSKLSNEIVMVKRILAEGLELKRIHQQMDGRMWQHVYDMDMIRISVFLALFSNLGLMTIYFSYFQYILNFKWMWCFLWCRTVKKKHSQICWQLSRGWEICCVMNNRRDMKDTELTCDYFSTSQ